MDVDILGQICVKDSILDAQIQKEMVLQRLYGNKEAIETHLSLCQDDTLFHKKLIKTLEHINDEIMVYTSEQ